MSIDYTGFAFPKNSKITKKQSKQEYCIMPKSNLYETERKEGLDRHEVFFGRGKRQLSIQDGLVIFITPEKHNADSKKGIHFNKKFDLKVKEIGQKEYEKTHTREQFITRYGKNYL